MLVEAYHDVTSVLIRIPQVDLGPVVKVAIKSSIESCTRQLAPYLSMFLIDSDADTKLPGGALLKVCLIVIEYFYFYIFYLSY